MPFATVPRHLDFYIDGRWVPSLGTTYGRLINPATEEPLAEIALGSALDVQAAVAAAKRALPSFASSSPDERCDLLRRVLEIYKRRYDEFAAILPIEMGAPITLARSAQAYLGQAHLQETITAAETFPFEQTQGTSRLVYEAAGIAALITPWNWPINQVVAKVAPALAAGCTMVLKPSEYTPLDALLFAEVLHEAGVPPGVFNLINGDGPTVGRALASHPDVDVVSFTGSTRAGIEIAKAGADTVKRVHQELGGKSPNVLLDDVDLESAVAKGLANCFLNSGQSCSVATRMLVPDALHDRAVAIAKREAEKYVLGDPLDERTTLGPLSNAVQFARVKNLIQTGITEGATLVTGGPDRPERLPRGYYVQPTVFADVTADMTIAREEIFGPVLCIMRYRDEDEAAAIANSTVYGLAAVVQSNNAARARKFARRIRAGHVYINHQSEAYAANPFGGAKQSGNGLEHGRWGIEGFLQLKAILGYQ